LCEVDALKIYKLFTTGPGGKITNKGVDYSKGGYPWVVEVRAASVNEAYRLLGGQIVAPTNRQAGVLSVDRSSGPPSRWPWEMDKATVAPQWS
jgi:hypothetical protein